MMKKIEDELKFELEKMLSEWWSRTTASKHEAI